MSGFEIDRHSHSIARTGLVVVLLWAAASSIVGCSSSVPPSDGSASDGTSDVLAPDSDALAVDASLLINLCPSGQRPCAAGCCDWVISRLQLPAGAPLADFEIGFDPAGHLHAACVTGSAAPGELHHAVQTGGGWSDEIVESQMVPIYVPYYSPAIAFDGTGNPVIGVITYTGQSTPAATITVNVARFASGAWNVETADQEAVSVVPYQNARLHVGAAADGTAGVMIYSRDSTSTLSQGAFFAREAGVWHAVPFPPSQPLLFWNLCGFDWSGHAYFTGQMYGNQPFDMFVRSGGSWTSTRYPWGPTESLDNSDFLAVGLSASGAPVGLVSAPNVFGPISRVASWNGAHWGIDRFQVSPTRAALLDGIYDSVHDRLLEFRVAADGGPSIAQVASGNLYYATRLASGWAAGIVASTSDGFWRFAVARDGSPAICLGGGQVTCYQ